MKYTGLSVILLLIIGLLPVAKRCAGEAGWAEGVHLCACTVKARLDAGWNTRRVLAHYYAPDGRPDKAMLDGAAKGLAGEECPANVYYLFSATDIRRLGLSQKCASAVSAQGQKRVYAYPRDALRRCRGV
jgi:hypothetical protein